MKSESIKELAKALAAAQAELAPAKKNQKNPYFKSNYADLAACFEAVREVFASHGLSLSQPIVTLDGKMALQTLLMHVSGEFIKSDMVLPQIADPQKLGGAITYFRRYALQSIAGLPVADDDGNSASAAVKAEVRDLRPHLKDLPELKVQIEEWLASQGMKAEAVPLATYSQLQDRIMKERQRLHAVEASEKE
jgi:hypothetical protein